MDAIDTAIITAFNNLAPKIRGSRLQAARRFVRTNAAVLTRPLRDSCLVLRASDHRINQVAHPCIPDYAPEQHLPHLFNLAGHDIAYLNEPIFIPYPGIPQYEAAKLFGRNSNTLTRWIKKGLFKYYTVNAHSIKKVGLPIRFLSTPQPLNPNSNFAQPPHPFFGSNWQYLHQHIPHNFIQTFHRTPIFRPYKNNKHFWGWKFNCPGLLPSNPNFKPCNRSVDKLYSPTTTFNLFKFLDLKLDLKLPNNATWTPGQHDPLLNNRAFACHECWNIRFTQHVDPKIAWNQLITQITAGLLFGHEVPMPPNTNTSKRKRKYAAKPNHKISDREIAAKARRAKVKQLLLDPATQNLSTKKIAAQLQSTPKTIYRDFSHIAQKQNLRTRKKLINHLNKIADTTPTKPNQN